MKSIVYPIMILVCLCVFSHSFGQELHSEPGPSGSEHDAIRQVDRKLTNRRRFPWYDSEAKQLRFIPPYIPDGAFHVNDEKSTEKSNMPLLNKILLWSGVMILTVAGVIVVCAIINVLRARRLRFTLNDKDRANAARRLENLLPEVQLRMDTLYADAEEAFLAGRYRDAIVFYFSFILVELDKAHLIVMEKSKTNHDYARELRPVPETLRGYLRAMNLFECTYYGGQAIDREMFLSVWEEREHFIARLRTPITATASGKATLTILSPLIFTVMIASSGCNRYWTESYTDYIPVYNYDNSINGDTLFRGMCRDAGHKCVMPSRRPKNFDRFDCIVWYYRSRKPLDSLDVAEVVWLNKWLSAKPGRSFLIVNEGFLADVDFWQELIPLAPSQHRLWCRQKLYEAREKEFAFCVSPEEYARIILEQLKDILQGDSTKTKPDLPGKTEATVEENNTNNTVSEESQDIPDRASQLLKKIEKLLSDMIESKQNDQPGLWFKFDNLLQVESATAITGDEYWAHNIPKGSPFRMTRKLTPLTDTKATLFADGMPLICERKVGDGQVFVLQSASFLLNYQLIHDRNRILASRLIRRLGHEKRILFLRSSSFVPDDREKAEEVQKISPFALSRLSAFSLMLWHVLFLTLAVFFWKFPIFGRPRRIPAAETEDFSRHLTAYGELLEMTHDTDWAKDEIAKWSNERGSG